MWRRFVFNNVNLKNRRQKLRRDSTDTEKILWYRIRNNKLGFKFFRQYSVEGYVLDFYCPEKKLAIEIDGGYHQKPDAKTYDLYRTKYIEAYGIKVIRFWNNDIETNLNKVLIDIKNVIMSPS